MRKRSEGAKGRDAADAQAVADKNWAFSDVGFPLYCGHCGGRQFSSPSGLTCENGHGGSPSVSRQEAAAIKTLEREAKSKELKSELDKDPEAPADPTAWASANAAREKIAGAGFRAIVETIFIVDPKAEYDRLEKEMAIGDKRTDYGTVMQHLDEAETNMRRANRLWQTAIVERKRWELDNEVLFAAMRSEATRSLQSEKDEGKRNKAITDADIAARIATLFPKDYLDQEVKRAKMKAMVDSLEGLQDAWSSRCRSLQTIASKLR